MTAIPPDQRFYRDAYPWISSHNIAPPVRFLHLSSGLDIVDCLDVYQQPHEDVDGDTHGSEQMSRDVVSGGIVAAFFLNRAPSHLHTGGSAFFGMRMCRKVPKLSK